MNTSAHLPALALALAAAAACLVVPPASRADVTSEDGLALKVTPAVQPKVRPFRLDEVRLLDGPFKSGQDAATKYLLQLEPDRLLARFRQEAHLTPKAPSYGGWEKEGVAGHSLGHYLGGLSLAWASTGDARFKERAAYVVAELAECQRANTNGYLAAIPNGRRIFAEVAAGNIRSAGFDLNGGWVPNYTLHKLFAGLRDAYRLCGLAEALRVERALADWLETVYGPLTEDQMQKVLACEHGGLNETFADLYADTGEARYLALSRKFHHRAILGPLARGEDILPGKHANTQIPKLVGLATRYELTGDGADRAAAAFFWDRVVNHHSYVTGGHCDHEHFGQPDRLNDRLSPFTTETCNVYNMLKLSRHVFGWEADAHVADFYERALLNHIRASQHPDGRVIYNVSLQPGHHKEYQDPFDDFTCCVGSGMENHVKYGDAVFFHDTTNLWINLYLPAELRSKNRGLELRQESSFPDGDDVRLSFRAVPAGEWTLHLRHPSWSGGGMDVLVNGQPTGPGTTSRPSSYLALRRAWKAGDTVDVRFHRQLRLETMPDNPRRLAFFHGPVLLAANLGPVEDPAAGQPSYVPVLVSDYDNLLAALHPVEGTPGTFETRGLGKPREVRLEPFHRLHDRRYTVYLDHFTTAEWAREAAARQAEQERLLALDARSVDIVRPGEMQPERDHAFAGERSEVIETQGRKGRQALENGWFGFQLKVQPDVSQELLVTYREGDPRRRNFDILIDGEVIGTQELARNRTERFFDRTYPIPAALTRGKTQVTVRFQSRTNTWAGGVYGVRILRPKSS